MNFTTAKRFRVSQRLFSKQWLVVVLALFIAACSTSPLKDLGMSMQQKRTVTQQLADAQRLSYPERAQITLGITKSLLSTNPELAKVALGQLEYRSLTLTQQQSFAMQQAFLAQQEQRSMNVLEWLGQRAIVTSTVPAVNNQAAIMRAQAYNRLGDFNMALTEWLSLPPHYFLAKEASYYPSFWHTLQNITPQSLTAHLQRASSPVKAWLSLALVYQSNRILSQQIAELKQWQKQWPNHPAQAFLPNQFDRLKNASFEYPKQIAVLLPLSGNLAAAGKAVRDGMMASYYQNKNEHNSKISFYDTASGNITELAQQAIAEGAQFIIGPLDKDQVEQMQKSVGGDLPILALNYLDADESGGRHFYQFGLAPEDEAVLAARRGIQDGHETAIIITPRSDWGRRVSNAFETEWKSLGGTVLDSGDFSNKTQFSWLTGNLLQVLNSEKRARKLQEVLGHNVEFQPRRRQDVDMVFIGANPQQARQIKPALSYQFAGNIPVYATASVYSGNPSQAKDSDLKDIRMPLIPWVSARSPSQLKQTVTAQFPNSKGALGPLYALGADAWQMLPYLKILDRLNDSQIQGETGKLTLNSKGKVQRELNWQIFTNNRLAPLPAVVAQPAEFE